MLELVKAVTLCASILSLYAATFSAFFVPGTRWEERLYLSVSHIAIAACVCFASGVLFAHRTAHNSRRSILHTLPVQLFFCGLAAMTLLFVVSWYLNEYYVPLLWRNQLSR